MRLAFAAVTLIACLIVPGAPAAGAAPTAETYTFVSAPGLNPPRLQVLVHNPGVAQGVFVTTSPPTMVGGNQSWGGPLLLDPRAQPVWFLPTRSPADYLQQQMYEGQPVLVSDSGIRSARVVIFNEHYRRIATIMARAPWSTDRHDAWITGGDIWITVGRLVQQNLRSYGGPSNATVLDEGLQEFQISTGRLIQTWDALNPGGKPNIPLSASLQPASKSWDAYHINSAQALPNGDLLVSMRNTSAVYLIDPRTNRTIWTLGGRYSSFKAGPGAAFAWQHDARFLDPERGGQGRDVQLTLFNNNDNGGTTQNPSAGMVLSLNTITRRATLVRAYHHYPPLSAAVMGSMQLLSNGNALVGWGSEPYFSEYSPSGRDLLDVRWPGAQASYRTLFSDTWVGAPYYPPSGAARGRTVYASWNGATEVSRWEVLAGTSVHHLAVVATHTRDGFETAVELARAYGVYRVRALDGSGRVLGTSKPFS